MTLTKHASFIALRGSHWPWKRTKVILCGISILFNSAQGDKTERAIEVFSSSSADLVGGGPVTFTDVGYKFDSQISLRRTGTGDVTVWAIVRDLETGAERRVDLDPIAERPVLYEAVYAYESRSSGPPGYFNAGYRSDIKDICIGVTHEDAQIVDFHTSITDRHTTAYTLGIEWINKEPEVGETETCAKMGCVGYTDSAGSPQSNCDGKAWAEAREKYVARWEPVAD
jgi:hypothetical protein